MGLSLSSRVLAAIALTSALGASAAIATTVPTVAASTPAPSSPDGFAQNPYLPSDGHGYRHGAFPTHGQQNKISAWNAAHPHKGEAGTATGPNTMQFDGGIGGGQAAVTGSPKIYLVFWGSQWGSAGTNANGDLTFSNDYDGGAPTIQELFKGLGTDGELWSGTMTQYCDGPLVATGATTCPSGAPHVGYPAGTALAGVWYDNTAEPAAATQTQLGNEAIAAAAHFGNTTAASNRYVQYDVLSAPGLDPDNYQQDGFCAWHTWTSSSQGYLAFTNMPYVMDLGAACGAGFVNSPGSLDGYSIVNGHEWAETLTDQFPDYGWLSTTDSEVGDECAWISSGQGAAGDVTLATGSFAMQSTWSNDTNECDLSHAIVTGSATNTVTVANPGSQSGTVGTAASLQIHATDSGTGTTLTYAASGLPAGLSMNAGTGLISGTPSASGNFSVIVTATDNTGAQGSASFGWTVSPSAPNTVTVANPGNQSGTVGTAAGLQIHAKDSATGAALTYAAIGLPAGLSINASTGLISGTPSTVNSYRVTVMVSDITGAHGSVSFGWSIAKKHH
jgi:serine protease